MSMKDPLVLIRDCGGKTAFTGAGTPVSYDDLVRGINACHRHLAHAVGTGPLAAAHAAGDGVPPRVLLIGDNGLAWIRAFYAILKGGMVAVPVDAQSTVEDIRYVIGDCSPVAVFAGQARRDDVVAAAAGLLPPERILGLEELDGRDCSAESARFDCSPDHGQTALIIYTSGTTGSPKGVMLSYGNLVANMMAVSGPEMPIYSAADRILMLLPLHHVFPLVGTLMVSLHVGATIVFCPAMHGEAILRALGEFKVTMIIGVPRLYSMIASGIQSRIQASALTRAIWRLAVRLRSPGFSRLVFGSVHRRFGGALHYMVCGGAALEPEIAGVFQTLGFDLLEGYGMTEAAPMLTFTRPGTLRPGSPGQSLTCVELRIQDGEILARGPNIMQGYFKRPAETAAMLADGWLHTGDLGELDADGFLHITGRRKEIIVLSNGKNINPAELESALQAAHPELRESAVYQDRDRLRALVVADPARLAAAGIGDAAAWARDHILKEWNRSQPGYRALAGILVSPDELPRTRLGKLRRFELPALAAGLAATLAARQAGGAAEKAGGESGAAAQPAEFLAIRDYLRREKQVLAKPSDHLVLDLGLDSLDAVGLQAFVETSYGITLPAEGLAAFDTVGDLVGRIAASKTRTSVELVDWARILGQKIRNTLPKSWPAAPLVSGLMRSLARVYFRFSARGLANIPDEPCIIVPNHQSFFDAFFIAAALRIRQLQKTFFYAKSAHFKGGLIQRLAKRNNIIIMDLDHNLKESILHIAEVLKTRRNLIIFPEGTRTRDGRLGDFKKMFAILSSELNVPVIPVSIRGAWEALPRGRRFPRPFRSIRLDFLPAIRPGNLSYDALTELVRNTIQRQLGPVRA